MNFVLKAQYQSFRNFSSSTDSGNYCKKKVLFCHFFPPRCSGEQLPTLLLCASAQHGKHGLEERPYGNPACSSYVCLCLGKLCARSSFASDGSRAGLLNIEISSYSLCKSYSV